VCGANLHQIGVAMTQYVMDNAKYPGHHSSTWDSQYGAVIVWPPRLRFYMKGHVGPFYCPAARPVTRWVVRYDPSPTYNKGKPYYYKREIPIWSSSFFGYGYNDWGTREFTIPHLGLGAVPGDKEYGELPERRVKVPSDMIAMADSNADGIWDTAIDPDADVNSEGPGKLHLGGAEVLFCDGHVAWFRQKSLVARDTASRARWNNDHKNH